MAVQKVVAGVRTPEGDGMVVRRAFPSQALGRIDPFLLFDEIGPIDLPPGFRSGFPDHPHRGFETVTLILEGEWEHKDSHGNVGHIGSGGVQWMTAGAGVVHSEMPAASMRAKGGRLRGLQLWVNLPRKDKMVRPRYQDLQGSQIPAVETPGAKVRIVAGEFQGTPAAAETRTPMQYLHLQLQPGARLRVPVPLGQQGFLYVLDGQATLDGVAVAQGQLAHLAQADGVDLASAGGEGCQAVLVTGQPLDEPVFQYGPFVMNDRQGILQAIEDFNAGRFGAIPATTD